MRDAKEIDALPILGVDPELVAWGGQVSSSLRDLASIQATGQRQVAAQTASASAPQAHYAGSGAEEGDQEWADAQTRADWNNYRRQRTAAAEATRLPITEQSGRILQDLIKSRNDIKAAMTQKYGVEF
jgi:hypothetical protein